MFKIDLKQEKCRVISVASGEHESPFQMRQAWIKYINRLTPINACHLVIVPAASSRRSLPINQRANMLNSVHELLKGTPAIAYVLDDTSAPQRYYDAGYARGRGMNAMVFRTIEEAQRWLDTQPHREGCEFA